MKGLFLCFVSLVRLIDITVLQWQFKENMRALDVLGNWMKTNRAKSLKLNEGSRRSTELGRKG